MQQDEKFMAAARMLGDRFGGLLEKIPPQMQQQATEIRLRAGRPLCVMAGVRPLFVEQNGAVGSVPGPRTVMVEKKELQSSVVSVCGWAIHTHQKEMSDGFVAVRGGHRAGIGGTAVVQEGRVTAVREITSLNLRVAREIRGAANELVQRCFGQENTGVLLAGAPASGKTTVLRDLVRQLAGPEGGYRKVCVVDESGEIGGAFSGLLSSDLGICSDLLSGYPKAKGLQIAVRYLSPQVLVCDEIATPQEVAAVIAAANCGVAVVTSVHAASMEELRRKSQFAPLTGTGAFAWAALLRGALQPGEIVWIKRMEELCPRC